MIRLQWAGSAICILVALVVPGITAGTQTISIVLKPRDYVDPRLENDFICGVNQAKTTLLAEQNIFFFFDFINNGEQPKGYRSEVFDVTTFTKDSQAKDMLGDIQQDLDDKASGLFTLFIAPPRVQCNSRTFADIEETSSGYYPIYVGVSSNFTEQKKKFISDVAKFKTFYNDELPKLCAMWLPVLSNNKENEVSVKGTTATSSKINLLSGLFDILYNGDDRVFDPSKEKECRTKGETLEAFKKAKFINAEPKMRFESNNVKASELDGIIEVKLRREATSAKAVGFVKTSFPAEGGQVKPADENDIVTYEGPVFFTAGEQLTSIFITLKQDGEPEEEEALLVEIKSTMSRSKRMISSSCSISLSDIDEAAENQIIPNRLENCLSWMNFKILSNSLKGNTEESKNAVLEKMTNHIMSLTKSFAEASVQTNQFQMFRRMSLLKYYEIYFKKVEGGPEWEPKRETWFSTSVKHSRLFINAAYGKERNYDVVLVFHLNFKKFEENFKNRIIHQEDASAFKDTKIEDLKNYVHRELLETDREPTKDKKTKRSINHPWTKYNFALRGQKNGELFNECIERVQICKIKPDPKKRDKFTGDTVKDCQDTPIGVGLPKEKYELIHFPEGEEEDSEEKSVSSAHKDTYKKYDGKCEEIEPKLPLVKQIDNVADSEEDDEEQCSPWDWVDI